MAGLQHYSKPHSDGGITLCVCPCVPGREQRRGGEEEGKRRRQETAQSMPNNIIWMNKQTWPHYQTAKVSQIARQGCAKQHRQTNKSNNVIERLFFFQLFLAK